MKNNISLDSNDTGKYSVNESAKSDDNNTLEFETYKNTHKSNKIVVNAKAESNKRKVGEKNSL